MNDFFQMSAETTGTDETEARLTALYGHVVLSSGDLGMREEHVGDGRFMISRFDFRGGWRGVADVDAFVVDQPVAGGGTWEIGRSSGELRHEPLLFQPRHPSTAELQDWDVFSLVLEPQMLQETARLLYADDRLVLRFDADPRCTGPAAGDYWKSAFRLAVEARNSMQSELVRASIYRLLAVSTLESFRLVGDPVERRVAAAALLHAYRRGAAFADANASLPITVLDIAGAAGVAVRTLEAAFRAHAPRGLSPAAYLRRTRLVAAHTDLRAADPTRGDTVRAIAARWGFPNPSRFARLYRQTFGTNPKWDLDR